MLSSLSLHFTHALALSLCYSGMPVSRPCSGATARPGHGAAAGVVMISLLFPYVPLPRSLCSSSTHSPHLHLQPPYVHVSKTVCIGTDGCPTPPPLAADPPTFDSCTASLATLHCPTVLMSTMHTCTYVISALDLRTVHALPSSYLLPPASCLLPPAFAPSALPSPFLPVFPDPALCFGFRPCLTLVPDLDYLSLRSRFTVRITCSLSVCVYPSPPTIVPVRNASKGSFSLSLSIYLSYRFDRLDVLAPLHAARRFRLFFLSR